MRKIYVKTAESENKRAQAFCPECGTPIDAADESDPQVFAIRFGAVRVYPPEERGTRAGALFSSCWRAI